MKELTRVFEGRNVRVFVDDAGEPWFVASDVCGCLGYTNPWKAVADHVAEGDLTKREAPSSSGTQSFNVINESGLYSLILGSKLPSAHKFKHWVTSEVLPSIRKTGGYGLQSTTINLRDPAQLAAFTLQLVEIVAEKDKQLEEQKPKVESFDAFLTAKGTYSLQETGKTLGVGANRFGWALEQKGYLYRNGKGALLPKQRFVDQGIFVLRVGSHTAGDTVKTHEQTRVTPKGLDYFRRDAESEQPQLFLPLTED